MGKKLLSITALFILQFSAFSQVYEMSPPPHIRTIQFVGNTDQAQLPIIELGQPLQMSFDDINGNEEDYYYVITHYDFDWTPSDLSKGEYLRGLDDVRIETYFNSLNTLQVFSHYTVTIPNRETRALTKSGNYLISIYNDDRELVFSRKFMIIENAVNVQVAIRRSRDFKFIETKQVVHFTINSPNLFLVNPKETVNTLVLQNSNLESAIPNLKPQYTLGQQLVYRYDQESAYWGGNEYFNFDTKDLRGANNTIRRVAVGDLYEHYLFANISRKDRPYTFNPDVNGNFVVRNLDARDVNIESDYTRVHFNLQYFEDIGDKEIHIYGNFNNYTIDESTYMQYDPDSDSYRNSRLFKQGFYNYKYVLVDRDGSVDEGAIGGNYWQTENEYTVLVYFRDLGGRFDRIVGMGKGSSTTITNN